MVNKDDYRLHVFVDLETLPTEQTDFIEDVKPPGTITKKETLEKWAIEKQPKLQEQALLKTSLDTSLAQVCCIGWSYGGEVYTLDTMSVDGWEEADILRMFLADISRNMHAEHGRLRRPIFVGHNIVEFDLPILFHKCIIHRVAVPAWLPKPTWRPYDERVYDTMTNWSGLRHRISLDKLCRVVGLEGKEITGEDVYTLWQQQQFQKIRNYCKTDVRRVMSVYKLIEDLEPVAPADSGPAALKASISVTADGGVL